MVADSDPAPGPGQPPSSHSRRSADDPGSRAGERPAGGDAAARQGSDGAPPPDAASSPVATPSPDAPPLPPEDRELLASLPPEVARLLYPDQLGGPVRIGLSYPRIEGPEGERAAELEAAARERREEPPDRPGGPPRHGVEFTLEGLEEFHELYHLVERAAGTDRVDVRINGHVVPLVRELWLPLLWTLLP